MRRHGRTLIFLILTWVSSVNHAIPCDVVCVTPKPEEIFRSHRYVMIARVTEARWDGTRGTFTVAAIRVWKGGKTRLQLETQGQGSMCGYVMEKGKAYVVYADAEIQPIGICEFAPIPAHAARQEIARFDRMTELAPLALPREDLEPPAGSTK
jgi:hypothetical protein